MRLTLNYIVIVNAALTLSCYTNNINKKSLRIYLLQLKIHNIWMKFFWNQKNFHLDIKKVSTLKQVIGYIIFNKTVCWYVIVDFF